MYSGLYCLYLHSYRKRVYLFTVTEPEKALTIPIQDLPPGPFSLIVPEGLPKDANDYHDSRTKSLRLTIDRMLGYKYNPKIVGGLARAMSYGKDRLLPVEGVIEPVLEHGVTFLDPSFFLGYPSNGQLKCRQAMKALILAATSIPSVEFQQASLAPEEPTQPEEVITSWFRRIRTKRSFRLGSWTLEKKQP